MRLKDLSFAEMSPDQRIVADEAIAGKRGHIPAPLRAWIHSPELGALAQRLGEYVRYRTSLDARLSELAILIVARSWDARYEWDVHKREALKAGLEPAVIEAIRRRATPSFRDGKADLVYRYAKCLLDQHFVPAELHSAASEALGEAGLAELVGVLGYYVLVAMTLNAFEIGLDKVSDDLSRI